MADESIENPPKLETSSNGDGKPTASSKRNLPPEVTPETVQIREPTGDRPLPGEDAMDPAVLEIRTPRNIIRVTQTAIDRAAKLRPYRKLGFTGRQWKIAKLMAAQEFGELQAQKLTARVLAVSSFDSLEQIQIAEEYVTKMLNDPNVIQEYKLAAVKMMAEISSARVKMQDHILKLVETAKDQDATPQQRKVLPPMIPTQVIAEPGSQVFVGANSGPKSVGAGSETE